MVVMTQFHDQAATKRIGELKHREEEAYIQSIAPRYGYQYIDLEDVSIDVDALRTFTEEESRTGELAVFAQGNEKVSIAIKNPSNPHLVDLLSRITDKNLHPALYLVSMHSLEHAWGRYKDVKTTTAEARGVLGVDLESIKEFARDIHLPGDVAAKVHAIEKENSSARVSKTIEALFGGALAVSASDIHIEPEAEVVRVRYRLDGVLSDVSDMEKHHAMLLIARLKLLAGLKLNVKKEAQDGRFTFDIGEREIEVRASVIPGAYGESIVMRLLDPTVTNFNFETLGLNAKLHDVMVEELRRPNGAIITTGPTGSGKTTALYAFLTFVHSPEIKIITLEDPVEYKVPGIVQTQVTPAYSFAEGLRSMLRQDPDVIMVGEIRDREVAETAVHAALTGNLVLSTLHTNSAVGAFPRLIDIGIDARMIGSAFNLILGQRLVRKLCEKCKTSRDTTTEEQLLIARIMEQPVAMHTIYTAPGCDACNMTGYKGRIGVFEAVRVDDAVETAIIDDPREISILEAAKPQGIPTMQQDGIMKVLAGITSLDEVSRVLDLYSQKSLNVHSKDPEGEAHA